MEVTIEKQGSGYAVKWDSSNVEMIVRHIKPKGFKAEVSTFLNGIPVHRSNPTLDSSSGMDGFARKLNKRRPKEDYGVDWEQIVEDLSGIVIDTYRTGQPALKLSEVDLSSSIAWCIENILLDGEINLIWADGGTGKSMFALFLSVLAQQSWMSTDHGLIVEPSNVLYLDYETKPKEIATRARMIHAGLGLEEPDVERTGSKITYNKCEHTLVEEEDYIQDLIYKNDISLVVIDSMGRAVSGEMESSDSVLPFMAAVERLNTTVLIISHSNKQGTLFGSAYTNNSARLVWEAKRSGSNIQGMDFSLFCRKANNVPMQPPQSWGVSFKDNKVVYTRGDVFATDLKGELSYRDLVYRILTDEGAKTREYLKDTIKGIKGDPPERIERNVDSAVSKHKSDGKVVEEDGILSLVSSKNHTTDDESWQQI